jgi:hypothetical protein
MSRPLYKQITPEQVKRVLDTQFKPEDYPIRAPAFIEGGYTVSTIDKSRPGTELGPARVSEFKDAYPDLGIRLESLPAEQQANFYHGDYLLGNGALNHEMQSLQRLPNESRTALINFLPQLGITTQLPAAGTAISDVQAYNLVEELVLKGAIDFTNYPLQGLNSLVSAATLIKPFEGILNFNAAQPISMASLRGLQIGSLTRPEFIHANLGSGNSSLKRALSALNDKHSVNIYKNEIHPFKDLEKIATKINDGRRHKINELIPLVLPLTPMLLKMSDDVYSLLSDYAKPSRLSQLRVLEYHNLMFDNLFRAQFIMLHTNDATMRSAATKLADDFVMEKGVVKTAELKYFAEHPEKEANV